MWPLLKKKKKQTQPLWIFKSLLLYLVCFFYSFSIFQNAHALSKLCSKYLYLFFTLSLKKSLQSSIWTLFSSSFCLHNLKSYWNARLWLQPPHISGPCHRLHRRALRLLFGALFNSPATCARVYKLKLAGFFFSSLRSVSSRFLRGRLERSLCSEQMFPPSLTPLSGPLLCALRTGCRAGEARSPAATDEGRRAGTTIGINFQRCRKKITPLNS